MFDLCSAACPPGYQRSLVFIAFLISLIGLSKQQNTKLCWPDYSSGGHYHAAALPVVS